MILDRQTCDELLALPVGRTDAGRDVKTIRDYLLKLLLELWEEGEMFSSKRPFGNSDWECEVFKPLIENGIVRGVIDSDGDIDSFEENDAYRVVSELIKSI